MPNQINLILILFAFTGLIFTADYAFGHGLTSEFLQGETLSGEGLSLNLYSTTSPTEKNNREIYLELTDSETKDLVKETTFLIKAYSSGEKIFEDEFQTDGLLILDMNMDSKSFSNVEERTSELDDPNSLRNAKIQNIPNLLNSEIPGGLFYFEIQILTAGDFSQKLEKPIVFESGLSFPSSEFFEINDPNYGKQEFGLIGYYDKPYGFNYDSQSRGISFMMPYSWPEHEKEDQFFIHNEILIPRTFGDLRYENFSAYINGIDQTQSVFNVDFALEDEIQVHIVTDWEKLNELSEKLKDEKENRPSVLEYHFVPTDTDAPYSSITNGGRYRINLDWEPEQLVSGSEAKFSIEILDIFTKDMSKPTEYHFTILHGDEEIFHTSGLSTDPITKTTELGFSIPENVSGPITIRFENLGGGIFSNLDFPAIVFEPDSSTIPDWIKNIAKWWSLTQISDQDFVKGLEYLIQNDVIRIPENQSSAGEFETELPSWLRNNAGWWSQHQISDEEFFKSIQWLIDNEFIKI
ncbi:MAG: hypothetical protein ACO2Y5_05240 [Nitrosopumilaceae archaeon]